jgi:hypothetical protein
MSWIYRRLAELEEEGSLEISGRWAYLKRNLPPLYRAFCEFGLDWAQIAIDGCRRKGVRPWVYFRMNDLHSVDEPDSLFHDPFFCKAKENGWLNGNKIYGHPLGTSGSVENLYNFACPEVREWLLGYIEEMVMRYDVFGFELDFMRNIYCFDYLNAEAGYQDLMTDLIRNIRAAVDRAEEKFGHEIKLAVRLGQSVEHNLVYGFDVAAWAKEGLVDLLIPSCEEVCNSGVDIPAWREAVGNGVALAVGFDSHVIRWLVHEATPLYAMRKDHLKAYAANYFNRGADGLYFNNYYSPDKYARFLDRAAAEEGVRTLAVSHQDIVPIGCSRYKPLPMALNNAPASLTLNMGRIRAGESVTVTVGFDIEDASGVTVSLNDVPAVSCEPVSILPDRVEGHYYDAEWYFRSSKTLLRYAFEGISVDGDFTVTLTGGEGNAVYLDVSVSP